MEPLSRDEAWLGTVSGLYFFDGVTYEKYTSSTTSNGLPNNYVTAIGHTDDGHLWVGTQNGLASFYKKKWKSYQKEENSDIPGDIVYDLYTKENDLWVSFRGGALWKSGKKWEKYTKSNSNLGLLSKRVLSILPGLHKSTWFGTREGLCIMESLTH